MSQWISVDTPPDTDRDVLILVDGECSVGWYNVIRQVWVDPTDTDRWHDPRVTHWMELPEKPQ